MSVHRRLFTLATLLLATLSASAQSSGPIQATLVSSASTIAPGQSFALGLRMKLQPHWHTYWINPGESGAPTKITLTGPAGFEFGQPQWPLPMKIDIAGGVTYGYEDEVMAIIPVTVPKELTSSEVTVNAHAVWLVCKETCIEGEAKLSVALPVGKTATPANEELFTRWQARLPVARADAIGGVEQASTDGSPASQLTIRWKQAPKKVEWFPVATDAVSVEKVVVEHRENLTHVRYKPTVYKADRVPGGRLDSLVVFEDDQGRRTGVMVPFRVHVAK